MKKALASMALSMLIYIAAITSQVSADQSEFHSEVTSGVTVIPKADISEDQSETTALTKRIAIEYMPAESGSVYSNKTISPILNAGYIAGGVTCQTFLSFNISGIPEGAVIKSVAVDLRRSDVLGDPFVNLGCMKAYPVFYNKLSTEYYYTGLPLGDVMRICYLNDLGSAQKIYPGLARALQNAVGSSRFQMRFQFDKRDTVFVGSSNFGLGGKGSSEGKMEVVGEASGEWKPCLPEEPKTQVLEGPGSKKDLLQFGTVRLLVTYIPPDSGE